MLSQGVKRKLSELVAEPSFRLRQSGDSIFGEATGKRPRRLSLRGQLNPAGQFLQDDKGVVFPRQGIDFTRRTVFRGNSEFATTVSGAEIRLRTPSGELTARGREYYTDPEITVEVPAFQNGLGRLGAFRLRTTRVYTEFEYPTLGENSASAITEPTRVITPGLPTPKSGCCHKLGLVILSLHRNQIWSGYIAKMEPGSFACGGELPTTCKFFESQ